MQRGIQTRRDTTRPSKAHTLCNEIPCRGRAASDFASTQAGLLPSSQCQRHESTRRTKGRRGSGQRDKGASARSRRRRYSMHVDYRRCVPRRARRAEGRDQPRFTLVLFFLGLQLIHGWRRMIVALLRNHLSLSVWAIALAWPFLPFLPLILGGAICPATLASSFKGTRNTHQL